MDRYRWTGWSCRFLSQWRNSSTTRVWRQWWSWIGMLTCSRSSKHFWDVFFLCKDRIFFSGFPRRKHQFSSWLSCSTMQFNRRLYSKNFNRVFSLEVVVTIISFLFRPVYAMVARKIGWACQLMIPNREFIFWLPMRKDHMHKNKNTCFKIDKEKKCFCFHAWKAFKGRIEHLLWKTATWSLIIVIFKKDKCVYPKNASETVLCF